MKFENLKKEVNKIGLKVEKYSPELLLGGGIISFGVTIYFACKQTLKAEEILRKHKEQMNDILEAETVAEEKPDEFEYDKALAETDKGFLTVQTSVNLVKTYAPVVAFGTLSLACILSSRNILNRRYLGVVTAYNSLSTVFKEYRRRVIDEQGKIMDRHFRYGTELETKEITEIGEDGKKHKIKEVEEKEGTTFINVPDESSKFFDSTNRNWQGNPEMSLLFLRAVENSCNDILKTRGHIFLNEVYESLGFDHTQSGSLIGWVDGLGDSYVDFGLYNPKNRGFVNGNDEFILLEFNHDGIIWDKI